MNRKLRAKIAAETVEILKNGFYQSTFGIKVNLSPLLEVCIKETQYYEPDELTTIQKEIISSNANTQKTEIEVVNETTLEGISRVVKTDEFERIAVLNFASAKNPGGGFLGGSQAQEESLARSSGLYKSLLQCKKYYEFHRSGGSCLYSDRIIYSPQCPIFRNDNGEFLTHPYCVDFITSPAPNAGAIIKNEPDRIDEITSVLTERSSKILALALYHKCDIIVLGAWGCGVFQNDPKTVAQIFCQHLDGKYANRFKKVLFSVFDKSEGKIIIKAFRENVDRMANNRST